MKKLLLIPFLFLMSGCSTLEAIPFAGGVFESFHQSYAEICEMDSLIALNVAQFDVNIGCDSDYVGEED